MNVSKITASAYLAMKESAKRNGADKPAFKDLMKELNRLPKRQERLVFEFWAMSVEALERGICPRTAVLEAVCLDDFVPTTRVPEYLAQIEKAIVRSFELLGAAEAKDEDCASLKYALRLALTTLLKRDQGRFSAVVNSLKDTVIAPDEDPRCKILTQVASRLSTGHDRGDN